jgi:hypothetical protein
LTCLGNGGTTFTVLFDTVTPPIAVGGAPSSTCSFPVSGLTPGVTYFWQVTASNGAGSVAGPIWSFTPTSGVAGTHPVLEMTPALVASMQAKVAANDADWLATKSAADSLAATTMPSFTFTAATNANPVEFTIAETVPWSSIFPVYLMGGSGNWAGVNHDITEGEWTATRTGAHTFTIPVNSTAFGSFSGQTLALMPYDPNSGNDYIRYGFEGLGWRDNIRTLGLAYLATGNASYSTAGRALLAYMVSLGKASMKAPYRIDQGFPGRSAIYALALGFDWFYVALNSTEKTNAITAGNFWYDTFAAGTGLLSTNGPGNDNYFVGNLLGFGLWGLTSALDNARAGEIQTAMRSKFDTYIVPAFATNGAFSGGFPTEAYVYGINAFAGIFSYIDSLRTATGENLFTTQTYAQRVATSLLYNLKPNKWQVPDEADYAGSFVGVLQNYFPLRLAYYLSGQPEGAYIQYLYNNLADDGYGGQSDYHEDRFVFKDTNRTATDYTSGAAVLPTARYSSGDTHMNWRSSWGATAVWAQINGAATNQCQQAGGNCAGHQLRTAGNLEIQRGNDYFIVNSGQWKGSNGVTGSPASFSGEGWRSNGLFHYDGGAYCFSLHDYAGCKGVWALTGAVLQQTDTDYAYVQYDLRPAYEMNNPSGQTLSGYHRSTVFAGSGVSVLFDRLTRHSTSDTDEIWTHFNPTSTLTVSGGVVKSVLGSSALFMKPLLPTSTTILDESDQILDSDFVMTGPTVTAVAGGSLTNGHVYDVTYAFYCVNYAPGGCVGGETYVDARSHTRITASGGNLTLRVSVVASTSSAVNTVRIYARDVTAGEPELRLAATTTNATATTDLTSNNWSGQAIEPYITKRVRVSDAGTPTTTMQFLHAFYTTSSATSTMPTTTKITSSEANYVGTSIVDGSTTWVTLFSIDGNAPASTITYAATIAAAGRHLIPDLDPYTSYGVSQGGTVIGQYVSSSQGVLSFSSTGGGTFVLTKVTQQTNEASFGSGYKDNQGRYASMVVPTDGETFLAGATDLRLIAAAEDPAYFSGPAGTNHQAAQVQFVVDGTVVLTRTGNTTDFDSWVAKGFASPALAVGTHYVWARATFTTTATVIESVPHLITVVAAPTYAQTITLSADTAWTSATLGSGTLNGSSGARIRVNGNGHRSPGAAARRRSGTTSTSTTWATGRPRRTTASTSRRRARRRQSRTAGSSTRTR